MVGVHPSTLARWADKGLLGFFKTPGGQRRFRRADVEALIAAGTPIDEEAS